MKKDKMAGLIDPDVAIGFDQVDFNLPVVTTVTFGESFGDIGGDGTQAEDGYGNFSERASGSEVVTEFGLHHGDSVRVFLMFVKG